MKKLCGVCFELECICPLPLGWTPGDGKLITEHVFELGDGTLIQGVHRKTAECEEHGCVIHNQTDHHMRGWMTTWNSKTRRIERLCPHGVWHPDPDGAAWGSRQQIDPRQIASHVCDGCCEEPR